MFMAVGLMSLAVTGYISLQTMLWIVSMLEANGYDVGTELIGGILVESPSSLTDTCARICTCLAQQH